MGIRPLTSGLAGDFFTFFDQRGIARALLQRVVEEAPRRGFRRVEAYPSIRARIASGYYREPIALHVSLGFQRLPGRRLVVRKSLETSEGTGPREGTP